MRLISILLSGVFLVTGAAQAQTAGLSRLANANATVVRSQSTQNAVVESTNGEPPDGENDGPPETPGPEDIVCGDVNQDGIVDLMDLFCVLDGSQGVLDDECLLEYVDCNSDGVIDEKDLCAVLKGFRGIDACCSLYGDVNNDGVVSIYDLFCILDAASGRFVHASCGEVDIAPCGGDGVVDERDVQALLDAFEGIDLCCGILFSRREP